MTTPEKQRELATQIADVVEDLAADLSAELDEHDWLEGDLLDRVHEYADTLFAAFVRRKRIDQYDVSDLLKTAPACCEILALAAQRDCVPDDQGLWEGAGPYSALATIAYFALEDLITAACADALRARRDTVELALQLHNEPHQDGRHPLFDHLVYVEWEPHHSQYIVTAPAWPGRDALVSEDDLRAEFGSHHEHRPSIQAAVTAATIDLGYGYVAEELVAAWMDDGGDGGE